MIEYDLEKERLEKVEEELKSLIECWQTKANGDAANLLSAIEDILDFHPE